MSQTNDDKPLKIEHVRAEIDRVDKALLSLIAERLDLAASVRRAKSGMRVWRPSREEAHVRDLAEAAEDAPANLVSNIWAELMSASLAIQGPMRLHIALEGDALEVWRLVRDRFGASIPAKTYPTASGALAAAYAEDEGVAVLPAPGGMNTWWGALTVNGAMPDMNILAGLPRVGNHTWPRAVAVATADVQPSGSDVMLVATKGELRTAHITTFRAEAGENRLYSIDKFIDATEFETILQDNPGAKIIGCLPNPLGKKA